MKIHPDKKPVVLIFRTGGIGDVVLSLVAIKIINSRLPGAKIIWFGRNPSLSLIKSVFPEIENRELRSSYRFNISTLKNLKCKPDIIIDLQRSARTFILGKITALHFKCKYYTWNKFSLMRSFFVYKSRIKGRTIKQNLLYKNLPNRYEAMSKCVLKALETFSPLSNAQDEHFVPLLQFHIQRKKVVAICLGALHEAKELPTEKIKEIISFISSTIPQIEFVLLGDKNKNKDGLQIQNYFEGKTVIKNLCGATSLFEAAQLLASCRFTIANDSALAHLSESVQTPVITFFGPTHEVFGYRPFLKDSISFSNDLGCRPCTKDGNTNCRYGDFKCKNEVSLEPVFKQIILLKEKTGC